MMDLLPSQKERWSLHPSGHWTGTLVLWQFDDLPVLDWLCHERNQNEAHIFGQAHSAVFEMTRHFLKKGGKSKVI